MEPVFLVAGDTAINPSRSGIQTVVRSLAAACVGSRRASVRLVSWNAGHRWLRPVPRDHRLGPQVEPLRMSFGWLRWPMLRQPKSWVWWLFAGEKRKRIPLHRHPFHRQAPPGSWVLLPELMYGVGSPRQLAEYAHGRGWKLAAIFYDSIPVDRPDFVPPTLTVIHGQYMRELADADLILPISDFSADRLRAFFAREGLRGPPVRACALACDPGGTPRVRATPPASEPGEPVRMLCVSTLERRKNHDTLLTAYALAVTRRPELGLELHLVGAPYVGAQDIVDRVRAAMAKFPGLHWHEQVEPERLQELYAHSDFTVYPSVLEGFGLPVIESLWQGRPCICANFGVMAENAAGGGGLTVDVRDPEALASAILTLADSADLRRRLTTEAIARPLKTWEEYADEVLACLAAG